MWFSAGTEKITVFPSHTGPSVAPLKGPATRSNFHSVAMALILRLLKESRIEDGRSKIENRYLPSSIFNPRFYVHTGTPGIPSLTRYTELRVVIKSVLQSESPQLKLVAWPGILSRPRRFPLGSIT